MGKGDLLISKDKKRIYECVGRWDKDIVLVPRHDGCDDQVLIYTPTEIDELISTGEFRKLHKTEIKTK